MQAKTGIWVMKICIINPALKVLMAEGINISYAMPADTLFTPRNTWRTVML